MIRIVQVGDGAVKRIQILLTGIGRQRRQYEGTGGIRASGAPHNVEEVRIQFIEQRKLRCCSKVVAEKRLVDAFEHQLVGIVLEIVGDLRPDRRVFG